MYELAFAYRDIPAEVDAVLAWHARHGGPSPPRTALELAAGPAAHAIELARRGVEVSALDNAPVMGTYARSQAGRAGVGLETVQADMTRFDLGTRVDLALCMCDSASHLLDLDAMVEHLRAVAAHLHRGGVYVLELAHPSDFLAPKARTRDRWRLTRQGRRVDVHWKALPVDPVTQLERSTLRVRVRNGDATQTLSEDLLLRRWTVAEIEAAVRLASGLQIAEWVGGFAGETLENGWRMIAVLNRPPRR
jgi:SAM-dependent methyltransferase